MKRFLSAILFLGSVLALVAQSGYVLYDDFSQAMISNRAGIGRFWM